MQDSHQDLGPDFTIWGDLRFQVEDFTPKGGGDKFAQILCFADVSWSNRRYSNILLLNLDIHEYQENEWEVQAEFSSLLPYMQPVEAFRTFLVEQMKKFLETISETDKHSPWSPIWMGIMNYVRELEDFDETRAILSQVRSSVERLQRRLRNASAEERGKIGRTAFRMLEALELAPITQKGFVHKESML